jgi:hypothetical protein
VRILTAVGGWMAAQRQHHLPIGKVPAGQLRVRRFSRKGNTLYMHVHFWPGSTVSLGGLTNQVKSARLLAGGKEIKFDQDKFRLRMTGLPEKAPDDPVTTIAIECDGEPHQDTRMVLKADSSPETSGPTSFSSVASVTSVISELREDEALARGRRAHSHGFLRVSVSLW